MIVNKETVPLSEAAALVGVSRRTIYNWLADGKIKAVRTAGGAIRVYADTLFKEFNASELRPNGRGKKE